MRDFGTEFITLLIKSNVRLPLEKQIKPVQNLQKDGRSIFIERNHAFFFFNFI